MLKDLYHKIYGCYPSEVMPLTKAGSNRQYFRLFGHKTVIGVVGTSVDENKAFIYLSRHFHDKGINVPQIHGISSDTRCYLQEDLGDISLFDSRQNESLVETAIALLPQIQYSGAVGLDFKKCYPVSDFDAQSVLWDLNYFKYCFLNTSGVTYRENILEEEFHKMACTLSANPDNTFMYRDFQSRNVMIKDGVPYFIDFQGGRRGPAIYDLVSFVNQSRAAYPEDLKERLISAYIVSASEFTEIDPIKFHEDFRGFSLLRNLQVLGAYGFRGRFERKPHFLKSISPAVAALAQLIANPFKEYPYLMEILTEMIKQENKTEESVEKNKSTLTVYVSSFSYKKGIPTDPTGNGGGFVFDCRGMENPGRYDKFKTLTGRDEPVIDFLEQKGEIITFLDNCYRLVDPSIECYDRRGFTSLTVNFGCTGGQHRSVYSAQKMAEHIKKKYPHITVKLTHREQKIDRVL